MEDFLPLILVALFGLVLGSFLNVLIYREGSGTGLGGRSRCLSCGKELRALMLIPVVSYLLQRGRCAHCGARISPQYPLVEVASAALVLAAFVKSTPDTNMVFSVGNLAFLLDAASLLVLLAILVYDLRHKIIPDRFASAFAAFALLGLLLDHFFLAAPALEYLPNAYFGALPWWWDILAGPLLALPFALLWYFSGGRAMGLGDAKLAIGIGWFLGIGAGLTAVASAFWIAFFPSLYLLFLPGKGFTMKSEIPFAPFLAIGTVLVYLLEFDLLNFTW